jgi:hypothetical protein
MYNIYVGARQAGFKCVINYQAPTVAPGGDLAKVQPAVCMIIDKQQYSGSRGVLTNRPQIRPDVSCM